MQDHKPVVPAHTFASGNAVTYSELSRICPPTWFRPRATCSGASPLPPSISRPPMLKLTLHCSHIVVRHLHCYYSAVATWSFFSAIFLANLVVFLRLWKVLRCRIWFSSNNFDCFGIVDKRRPNQRLPALTDLSGPNPWRLTVSPVLIHPWYFNGTFRNSNFTLSFYLKQHFIVVKTGFVSKLNHTYLSIQLLTSTQNTVTS